MTIRVNPLKLLPFIYCLGIALPVMAQPQIIPVMIHTKASTVTVQAEIARTPKQQEQGLMGRTALPKHHGMLFPLLPPRLMQMWMKDTLVPLDMVFINAEGRISMTAANNQPGSLLPVGPARPVSAVLELPAGTAEELAIAVGDRVEYVLPPE